MKLLQSGMPPRRRALLAVVAYLTRGQGVNRTRFRNDIDDAIFSTLDDDFFQPGAQSWKRTEWESSVTGEHPTREQTRNLPLCNVTCDRVFNESAFVFTPNREHKRPELRHVARQDVPVPARRLSHRARVLAERRAAAHRTFRVEPQVRPRPGTDVRGCTTGRPPRRRARGSLARTAAPRRGT